MCKDLKKQLLDLIRKGYSLEKKREILAFAELHGAKLASKEFNSTPSTVRRMLEYKKELNEITQEEYARIKNKKQRVRNPEYYAKHMAKHGPKNKRKKHPLVVIAQYANSNYKLVCYRNGIVFDETQKLKPSELWSIAKKQRCKCALSGISLINYNVSVDHVIPISRGGTNTISNIRLVDNRINKMRNVMTDTEFINLCLQVCLVDKQVHCLLFDSVRGKCNHIVPVNPLAQSAPSTSNLITDGSGANDNP